jgi:hypothetical protein
VKHGLLSNSGVLRGEDIEAFARFRERIHQEFALVGTVETSLVDRVLWTLWRLRRVPQVEVGCYAWHRYAMSRDGIVGYDKSQFRARVEKAATDQCAPGFASASDQDRPVITAQIQQMARIRETLHSSDSPRCEW